MPCVCHIADRLAVSPCANSRLAPPLVCLRHTTQRWWKANHKRNAKMRLILCLLNRKVHRIIGEIKPPITQHTVHIYSTLLVFAEWQRHPRANIDIIYNCVRMAWIALIFSLYVFPLSFAIKEVIVGITAAASQMEWNSVLQLSTVLYIKKNGAISAGLAPLCICRRVSIPSPTNFEIPVPKIGINAITFSHTFLHSHAKCP